MKLARLGPWRASAALVGAQLVLLCLLSASSAAASTQIVSPLPESDYSVRPACVSPARGHAGCLALELRPQTNAAKAHERPLGITRRVVTKAGEAAKVCEPASPAEGCYGLRPQDLKDAYFHGESPESPATSPLQTIALVDAYNDYAAEADLKVYDKEFGLPEITGCQTGQISDCFEQVNQRGERINASDAPFPSDEEQLATTEERCVTGKARETRSERTARERACNEALESDGWAVEISTDIEVARGICQNCRIVLMEADSASYEDLEEAEQSAVRLGATEISNSWGGEEPESAIEAEGSLFNHPGVLITAAAGDTGYLKWAEAEEAKEAGESYYAGADYPAASPHVIAVGGTKLELKSGFRTSETVWNEDPDPEGGNEGAGGGGCSAIFGAPSWQREVSDWSQVGCGSKRAVADVAADADPYSGVAVYDSVPDLREEDSEVVRTPLGWLPIGGTSVASPIVASLGALAGGAQEVAYPAQTLYAHLGTTSLFDVTEGGNGKCDGVYDEGCSGSMTSLLDCGEGKLICNAGTGYDGPTGVGTPNGLQAFRRLPPMPASEEEEEAREAQERSLAETQRSEEATRIAREQAEREQREEEARKERERQQAETRRTEEAREEQAAKEEQQRAEERRDAEESAKASTKVGGGGSSTPTTQTSEPKLLALALTSKATVARSIALRISKLSFTFKLSGAAKLQAKLARQVQVNGHKRWRTVAGPFSFAAPKGRSTRSLAGHRKLARGRYRLTLSISGGGSRSIVFTVG